MTLAQFSSVFALLAVQLRATDADEATIRGYYQALKGLEFEFVKMAADRLASQAEWFPKTSEWREMAGKVEYERQEIQRGILRQLPDHLCLVCDDTGWDRTPHGAKRCACQRLRRLEVLGIRPMPGIPAWTPKVLTSVSDIPAAHAHVGRTVLRLLEAK